MSRSDVLDAVRCEHHHSRVGAEAGGREDAEARTDAPADASEVAANARPAAPFAWIMPVIAQMAGARAI